MSSLTATRSARPARTLIAGAAPLRTGAVPQRGARAGASRPASGRRTRRGLHLTARGRLLLVLVLSLALLGAFAVGRAASSQATDTAPATPALTSLTVQPGDTLWSVARRVAPGRDPRDLVAQLRRLNDLPSASLQVGQQLVLPAVS